ncbi:hypothetical protein RCL1_003021 [Eukaryota sp. TZLM3-RCL]
MHPFILDSKVAVSSLENEGHFLLTHTGTTFRQDPTCTRFKFPISATFYFELDVASLGNSSSYCAGIGLVPEKYPLTRAPGWESNSIAYHGDDGNIFLGSGRGTSFNFPPATIGETIGCLVDNNEIRFTHNGVLLEKSFALSDFPSVLYPSFGLNHAGEVIVARLAPPFLYADAPKNSSANPLGIDFSVELSPQSQSHFSYSLPPDSPTFDSLTCAVCLETLSDPLEALCCNNLVCTGCATRDKCPCCRATKPTLKPNIPIRRMIDNLPVICDYCDYKTTRGQFSFHLKSCSRRMLKCKLCGESVASGKAMDHLQCHSDVLVSTCFV